MRSVLITGANGQIGSYLAKEYHREGRPLALCYHNRTDRIAELQKDKSVWHCSLDLEDDHAVRKAMLELFECKPGFPEVVIHCAAMRSYDATTLAEGDPEVFMKVFNSNFLSTFHLLKITLPLMQEKQWGRVVIMGSDVTQSGLRNGAAYAAAKSAMVSLVKSCAKEMAPFGVLINAISPGPVETFLEEDFQGDYLCFRKKYFRDYLHRVPTGKLVQIPEIKKIIDTLICDEISNLTGEELMIRGGLQ